MNPATEKVLYEKGLPAASLAEQMVLGALVSGAVFPVSVQAVLTSDDFTTEAHRRIFGACCALSDKGITVDRVTLAGELDKNLASVGGLSYLCDLERPEEPPDLENFINAIKGASVRRKLIHACNVISEQSLLSHNSSETQQWAENLIAKIGDDAKSSGGMETAIQVIQNGPGGANEFFRPKRGGSSTPWSRLNEISGEFRPGQLIVLGAYTGMGKSAAAAQIAQYAAQCNKGVAFFSLEMNKRDILTRMGCQRASIDSHRFKTGWADRQECADFERAIHEIKDLPAPIHFNDTCGITVMAAQCELRKLQANGPINLVIIDYLQLMDTINRHENRVQQVTEITRGLKRMAVEQQVAVLALSQLNRSSQDGNPPSLKHLRESGSIEQDADKVILLHQINKDNGEWNGIRSATDMEFRVEKNREGPTGKITLLFQRSYTRFDDVQEPVRGEYGND